MMDVTDSRVLYTGLVGLVATVRLAELAVSRRNIDRLVKRGAVEVGAESYPWMVALHGAFLVACPFEVWALRRPLLPLLAAPMLALLAAAAALRVWAIVSLRGRWNTRVVYVPGEATVTSGPYRWIRHPNYLAVIAEFVALPLVHTAWLTAAVTSLANGLVLRTRIRIEEEALRRDSGYGEALGDRPAFLPRVP